ncbi:hypothetical protein ACFVP3_39650, partial [Streptomyces sp. NPDC057806]
ADEPRPSLPPPAGVHAHPARTKRSRSESGWLLSPDQFLTTGTLQTIFGSQQALVFIGLGALCAFSVGEFDFSVAAVAGLSATLVAVLVSEQGLNVWLGRAPA